MQESDFGGYRFQFSEEKLWKKHLEENGFVVIANYLPKSQCTKYVNYFWNVMEVLSDGNLQKKKVQTQKQGKNYPTDLYGGMIQYIGHSKAQWELRVNAKPLFEKIWKTDDLKSSFEGFCFMNGKRNYRKKPINASLHTDQAPSKNYLWSYQGVQTLTDAMENEGGFVAVPKSNHYHHQYFQSKNLLEEKRDWYLIPEEDKEKKGVKGAIKVNNKAGDFILFDSRTFHCNTVPQKDNLRICVYICLLPSSIVPDKIQEIREKAFQKRRNSNHHSGNGFKMFPVLPNFPKNKTHVRSVLQSLNDCDQEEEILAMI